MSLTERLLNAWKEISTEDSDYEGYYSRRLLLENIEGIRVGIHKPGNRRFLWLEVPGNIGNSRAVRDDTRGYVVETRDSREFTPNSPSLSVLILRENGGDDIFANLCADVLEHWARLPTDNLRVASFKERLEIWKRFFKRSSKELGREEYIGLFGELSFLELALNAGLDPRLVVTSWKGPEGANQDFLWGSVAVEVKTTTSQNPQLIQVSNVRQLDPIGLDCLFLFHFAFDFRENSGRRLGELVRAIRESLLKTSVRILQDFNDRLLSAGYLDNQPSDYANWGFTTRMCSAYAVTDSFPRIAETSLPLGISKLAYQLDLSVAHDVKKEINEIWHALR